VLENKRLQSDCKLLNTAKEIWQDNGQDQMLFNTQKLISRIEELEDLVVELRTTNSA